MSPDVGAMRGPQDEEDEQHYTELGILPMLF